MAENSAQERTEPATQKKKGDAREKGQVPRSRELETFTSLFMAGIGMLLFGKNIVSDVNAILVNSLQFGQEAAFSGTAISASLTDASSKFIFLLAPLFLLLAVSAIFSPLAMGGWIFSLANIAPKLERISPLKGMGRIFSVKSLLELAKAIGKFVLVAGVTTLVLGAILDDLFLLPLMPVSEAFGATGMLFIWCFLGFSSVLILIALVDVPFQLWSFSNQLKMTKQEIRDESKETDGRPEIKQAIRDRQQQISQQRMMAEVPKADVIITNPTHFAVALRYDPAGTSAPKVVAKGRDLVAQRIKEVAKENRVAIFEAPPLARALYASTRLNQEIPGNLFLSVAQVLAYIFQLKRATGGGKKPIAPVNLSVPEDYESYFTRGGIS